MKRKFSYKALLLALLALLICLGAVTLSVAYLKKQTGAVTNTFVRGEDPTLTYWLDYNLNGGESDTIKPETVEATEEEHNFTVTSEEPSRLGYQFLGWADTADAKAPTYHGGSTVTVTKDDRGKTLYAVWQEVDDFVLYFQSNLPDSVKNVKLRNMPETMTAKYAGSSQHTFTVTNVPYDENADATGLTFLGWTSMVGGKVVYPAADTIDVTVTQKVTTLYAVWGFEYYVEFDRNPGDGTVGKYIRENGTFVNEDPEDQIILGSDSQTVSPYLLYESGVYSYVREKHLLVGFSSAAGGTTPEEYVTVAKPGRNNAETVYAIWAQGNYALIYDANGGSNAPATQTATAGELSYTFTINTKIPDRMEGSNGVFKGWAYTADAETPYFVWDEESKTFNPPTVELDINDPVRVLYAVWEYTYTLTYQRGSLADTDSPMPENQTAKSSKPTYTFTIPKDPTPTRDGGKEYMFHYWAEGEERINGEFRYCDNNGFYFDQVVVTAVEPSIALYPRFRPTEGYRLEFNTSTPKPVPVAETTQTICTIQIPPETPIVTDGVFLGWADKAHYDKHEVQYQPGDLVRLNPDVEGHTLMLYAVTRRYDRVRFNVKYNGGVYTSACGTKTTESTSRYEYIIPYGTRRYALKNRLEDKLPTQTNYTLKGANYTKNAGGLVTEIKLSTKDYTIAKDRFTISGVVIDFDLWDAGKRLVTVEKTYDDGSKDYTIELYLVWARDNAYDRYCFSINKNCTDSTATVSTFQNHLILQTTGNFESTFNTTSKGSVTGSRSGYRLAALAYDAAGTEIYSYVSEDGSLDKDVVVSQRDERVKKTTGGGSGGGNKYELTLYAIWEPQHIFNLTLNDNGGSYWDSSSSKFLDSETKTVTRPPEETTYTWGASTTYNTPTRYGYVLKGFAYTEDATEPDFIMSGNKFPEEGITVDKSSPYAVSGTTNGVLSTTLTLYAVWEKQQIFRLVQDFNGGTYTYSGGSTVKTEERDAIVEQGPDSYTFSTTTPKVPIRSGYRLLGYAYTEDATVPDFVRSGTSFTPGITISKLDTDREIRTYQLDGVDVTELTVYAVWEKEKSFTLSLNPNGGSPFESSTKYYGQSETQATWKAGSTITVPTRDGFACLGYATSKDATEPDYPVRDIYYDSSSKTNRAYLTEDITFTDEQEGVIHNKDSAPETHTLTLYAVWKPMRRFAVTINQNVGKSPSDYTTYSSYYDKSVTSATIAVSSSTNNALSSYPGYNLKGAAYTLDAKAVNFDGNSFSVLVDTADTEHGVTVTTDDNGVETVTLRLYAIWSVKLWYEGKGSDLPSTVEVINPTAEERVVSIAPKQPTHQNFLFTGWATASDASVAEYGAVGYYTRVGSKEVSPTVTLEKNTTLYAVWMQKYTLGFDANGGDKNSTPNIEVAYVTLTGTTTRYTFSISPNKPNREDYTFLGWSTKPNATAADYQPSGTILVNGNTDGSETVTTLYAVWQEDTGETTADETTETDGPLLNGSGSPTSPSEKLE